MAYFSKGSTHGGSHFVPISKTQTRLLHLTKTKDHMLSVRHQVVEIPASHVRLIPRPSWLSSRPKFEALSYHWGDPTPTHNILLNGQHHMIHQNLFEALWGLTNMRPEVLFWTDAICIDQSNKDEVAEQINLMFDIYRSAQHVWAWLGEGCPGIPEALSKLPLANSIHTELADQAQRLLDGQMLNGSQLSMLGDVFWQVGNYLISRPFFTRLWTLQEVAAATKISFVAGADQIELAQMDTLVTIMRQQKRLAYLLPGRGLVDPRFHITRALFVVRKANPLLFPQTERITLALLPHLRRLSSVLNETKHHITPPHNLQFNGHHQISDNQNSTSVNVKEAEQRMLAMTLGSFLRVSMYRQCSEPKDNILALQGLLTMMANEPVEFPWAANMSCERVFLEAFYFLTIGENITNLLRIDGSYNEHQNLPTWCRDFGSQPRQLDVHTWFGCQSADWQASSTLANVSTFRVGDGTILRQSGTRIGSVVFALPCPELDVGFPSCRTSNAAREVATWLEICRDSALNFMYSNDSNSQNHTVAETDRFWEVFATNPDWIAHGRSAGFVTLRYEDVMEVLNARANGIGLREGFNHNPTWSRKITATDHVLSGRAARKSFFITDRGLFGLGQPQIATGDELWVFKSAKMPSLIYGPFYGTGGEKWPFWKYRGTVLVPNIMHGEAESRSDIYGTQVWNVDLI